MIQEAIMFLVLTSSPTVPISFSNGDAACRFHLSKPGSILFVKYTNGPSFCNAAGCSEAPWEESKCEERASIPTLVPRRK